MDYPDYPDYPELPAFLDRRPCPNADGESSVQQRAPTETSGQQQVSHPDASTLRAKSDAAGPAHKDGADKEIGQGTIAEIRQCDGNLNREAKSGDELKHYQQSEVNLNACGRSEREPVAQRHEAKENDDVEIRRLAELSSLEYEHEREGAARRLGIRVTILDDQVKQARTAQNDGDPKGQGRPISFPEPEPWSHVVEVRNCWTR
jgi:hypothetical protein